MQPYVGNAVEGISTVTGKPFAMTLKAGGVAEVSSNTPPPDFPLIREVGGSNPMGASASITFALPAEIVSAANS
jgi:hypothetical protein